MKSKISYTGRITVTTRHSDGRVEVEEFDNLITDLGLDLLRDYLDGDETDGKLDYMAVGTGAVAPANGDTALGSEQFRKAVTLQTKGTTGRLTTTTYLSPAECVFHIKELGWFVQATDTPGSGVLIARVLYDKDKTNLESIQVDRVDAFERG